ncbi:MAG: T9SS type A sorting domain-containing protein [Ignavibacteriae bacterium]|nr:T9SS type A sorting domain-containing protein [Ignavibacteriota bacterium]
MKTTILFFLIISSYLYADTTKVLFIGNSYTYVNDLPVLFKNLSASGGEIVYTDMQAPGGYTLENHLTTTATLDAIKRGIWNYVVLQEQSQTPVIEYLRYHSMYPSAIKLDSIIKYYNQNANTVFFMTWGRKNGGQQCIDTSCSPVFINYFHMQDSLKSSYTKIASILSAMLSPAGEAWRTARLIKPYVNLWDADDSHPTLDGSYLTACVFYAKIFNQSPVGLIYNAGLPDSSALFYQQCAWQTVSISNHIENYSSNFDLYQNYPNPFNSSTIIKFYIPKTTIVNLKVYDLLGREITTLINKNLQSGTYSIPFSISQFSNNIISSGIYFYRLQTDDFSQTKKLVLIK